MSVAGIYFLVFGPVLASVGLAVLIDFRGLGRRWETEVNRSGARVGRLFGWPSNRYAGRAWRPFAGLLFLLVGAAMVILVLAGAIG
jgi:hypothetical protein